MKKLFLSLILITTVTLAGLMTQSAYQKIKNSKLSALQLANVEALAQDVENNVNKCPSPYDAWGRVLSYGEEKTASFTIDINGNITIAGKSLFVGGRVGTRVFRTYHIANCEKASPNTCCDHTKIGDVKVI